MQRFISCTCRKTAKRQCPWACRIVKVDGGFMAFEHLHDYQTWADQK